MTKEFTLNEAEIRQACVDYLVKINPDLQYIPAHLDLKLDVINHVMHISYTKKEQS